jgi:DNA-directed RNA polymerase specialized sigma24 family protein
LAWRFGFNQAGISLIRGEALGVRQLAAAFKPNRTPQGGSKLPHSKAPSAQKPRIMPNADQAERLEKAFTRAGLGDADAFAEWMRMVEHPLRRSLARFARYLDVEVVVQETFLRMWLAATNHERCLEGENASLKFAFRVARNVVREELRRMRPSQIVGEEALDGLPESGIVPEFPDPFLRRAIVECFDRLPAQPKTALNARIQGGYLPDRDLAEMVRMRLNTFLQNIVRARKLMAECLESRGVQLGGIL